MKNKYQELKKYDIYEILKISLKEIDKIKNG